MKTILIALISLMLSSCGAVGDYYVLSEGGEEKSHSTLYKDKNIFAHLFHFDGNVSTLRVYQEKGEKNFDAKLIKVEQSLWAPDGSKIPSVSRNDTQGIKALNPDSSVLFQFSEVYQIEKPYNHVTEKIYVEILVGDVPVSISKEFSLKRVTYNSFQALMGI